MSKIIKRLKVKRYKDENAHLKENIMKMKQKVAFFEVITNSAEQYGSRNNTVISDSPNAVDDKNLAILVIKVFQTCGFITSGI